MAVDMTDARQKLDLAMKKAREGIGQLNHLTTTPKKTNINGSDERNFYTSVLNELNVSYDEWLHAMQAVGNSEDDRGQDEILGKKDEVVQLEAELHAAWNPLEQKIAVEAENKA